MTHRLAAHPEAGELHWPSPTARCATLAGTVQASQRRFLVSPVPTPGHPGQAARKAYNMLWRVAIGRMEIMAERGRRVVIAYLLCIIIAELAGIAYSLWYRYSYTQSTTYLIKQIESDDDSGGRLLTMIALSTRKEDADRIVPTLVHCLEDPDQGVREVAAFALGELGPAAAPAAGTLVAALPEGSKGFQTSILHALTKIGPTPETEQALPQIASLIARDDIRVSMAAAGTLRAIGGQWKGALPVLAQIIKDASADPRAHRSAQYALIALARRHPELTAQALAVADELKDSDPWLSKWIRRELEEPDDQPPSE